MIAIRKAEIKDAATIAALACLLWPDNCTQALTSEFEILISSTNAAIFLAERDANAVGFAQCQLRRDYVEGTATSPVGYLEGIFVREEYRRQGIAKSLLRACEAWSKMQGCAEFASDCELTNTESLHFHLALGFLEANRIICFTKQIGE